MVQCQAADDGTAAVSVNRATEVWTFHYLNPLCWEKNRIRQENCVKKQLTVFIAYFSGGVSLGGMGLTCKPHREGAGNDSRKE